MKFIKKALKQRALLLSLLLLSCATDEEINPNHNTEEYTEATSDLKILLSDRPANGILPNELKADEIFPTQFDLIATQSTIKNQGSRGVCSIFSTVALMEHFYIKQGAVQPDFSEQFLQWSVKAELGKFTDTSGSNGTSNLEAINRFGIVEESVYPYQSYPWTTMNDPACTGEKQPYHCYTNGDPSEEIKKAKRYTLPQNRWINSNVQNIKAFMHENQSAVIAGMEFFYQSWNHGKSPLPVSNEYKTKGYVLYPNEKDIEESRKMGAGHSILIVGWDDELEVPMMDEKGQAILDANGVPKKEKGFFLFKNSWGTSVFGTSNPFGAGYGWLSMKYVEEFGSVVSAKPLNENFVEKCGDALDNNFDGKVDCEDSACLQAEQCLTQPTESTQFDIKSEPINTVIPDYDTTGIESKLAIEKAGNIEKLMITIDISHPYQEDLAVSLVHPSGEEVLLFEAEGRNQSTDLIEKEVTAFIGKELSGTWTLKVKDLARQDEGKLVSWGLKGKLAE